MQNIDISFKIKQNRFKAKIFSVKMSDQKKNIVHQEEIRNNLDSHINLFLGESSAEIYSEEVNFLSSLTEEEENIHHKLLKLSPPPANQLIRASSTFYNPFTRFKRSKSKNNGWRNDCLCSELGSCSTQNRGDSIAYFSVDLPRLDTYFVRFWLNHYGLDYYAPNGIRGDELWDRYANTFDAYKVFKTDWLSNTGSSGGIKFRNGNNNTRGGRLRGTIGIEVKNPNNEQIRSRWLLEPTIANFGRNWKHCGHRFRISIGDLLD